MDSQASLSQLDEGSQPGETLTDLNNKVGYYRKLMKEWNAITSKSKDSEAVKKGSQFAPGFDSLEDMIAAQVRVKRDRLGRIVGFIESKVQEIHNRRKKGVKPDVREGLTTLDTVWKLLRTTGECEKSLAKVDVELFDDFLKNTDNVRVTTID
jgi:hypothetical protein